MGEPEPEVQPILLTLEGMQAHSALAEVQALTDETLALLEAEAIDIVEAELGRRITADETASTVRVQGNGTRLMSLPEHLITLTSVVGDDGTSMGGAVELICDGWVLRAINSISSPWSEGSEYRFRGWWTVIGVWGWTPTDKVLRVLMDVVEALAVRKADLVTRRNELSPWSSVTDGGLSASRGQARRSTVENLLRYDMKSRLRGAYKPKLAEYL